MEFAYLKVLETEKLTIAELPEDAKVGIASINQIARAIAMVEKKGKKPRADVYSKLKANDKWVVREILDYVQGKDTNAAKLPNDPDKVVDEIKTDAAQAPATKVEDTKQATVDTAGNSNADNGNKKDDKEMNDPDPKGIAVEEELKVMHKSGKLEYTLEELKTAAPKTYNVIFDSYDDSGDNGVVTSIYSLTETNDKIFTLKQN